VILEWIEGDRALAGGSAGDLGVAAAGGAAATKNVSGPTPTLASRCHARGGTAKASRSPLLYC